MVIQNKKTFFLDLFFK